MLPPLKALVVFEAVSRHLSFRLAAQELGRTAPAVSQMIQILEESLQVKLFMRFGREVALTPAGEDFIAIIRPVLLKIERSTQRLKDRYRVDTSSVSRAG